MLEDKVELRKGFERRWKNMLERSKKFDVSPPDKTSLWNLILRSCWNGFSCEYCGQKMLVKDIDLFHMRSFSIDHRKSLWNGGTNNIDNFAIVCTRCNIIKGTMSDNTFQEMIGVLIEKCGDVFLDRMFEEIYSGRLADKLQRDEQKKSQQ